MIEKSAKPFLKWAGGKTQLLAEVGKNLPDIVSTSNTDERGIALGSTPEDLKSRKRFITDFYANWIIANPTKHVFNKFFTVGELRGSGQKIQYCITAIENDY